MKVFIIPYRDREEHKQFFLNYIHYVVPDNDYEIYFAHQCDQRPFNRGAMKNIGFLAMKEKYPNDYQHFSFIFNDVDIMPYTKDIFHYSTENNVIKHNYGYTSCLSACFVIKGSDFEKINGFPNIWAWGLEDYIIQNRALSYGITIDRSKFKPLGSKSVLQLYDGITRKLNNKPIHDTIHQYLHDGISNISNLKYTIDGNMIHIHDFITTIPIEPFIEVDVRDIHKHDINKNNIRKNKQWKMFY